MCNTGHPSGHLPETKAGLPKGVQDSDSSLVIKTHRRTFLYF